VLRDDDLRHPHGLCFDPVGGSLYVADAGESHVHVFMSGGDWQSANGSTFKLPAVDVDAFRKTREAVPEELRALEGGIKGIDIDPSGRVLATTCRHQTLRFFEILR
jgi:DNA-binding beta-propeller fold protein YncE